MSGTNPKGLIGEQLFHQVLNKLSREFPKWQLHFYNWTEPLIHPRIVEFSTAAAQLGFHLHLSSNLNYLKDPERLIEAGAKTFRISLSGFTQEVYEKGHRGGNIEKVKANMQRLAKAKHATGSRTRIHVYFHKYRHNLHELELMERFSRDLGFDFLADWAFLMPVEKLIDHAEGRLPDDEQRFASSSIVPDPNSALGALQPHRREPCELIDQLVLDYEGNVSLCCAVYEAARNRIGNYLDLDWPDLQQRKYGHGSCSKCMHYAAHVLYTHFGKPDLRRTIDHLSEQQLQNHVETEARGPIRLPILHTSPLARSA